MDEGEVEVEVEGVLAKLKHKPTPFTSPWNNRCGGGLRCRESRPER